VHVAFSPERIDPGVPGHQPEHTPRVVGGLTPECTRRAAEVLRTTAKALHLVSSAEAAELTKLLENTFRAINLAFVNEIADTAGRLGLDIAEVIDAAATKPYGFMAFRPGPGVGGHCIPCDPHYLAVPMREAGAPLPLTEQAMRQIAGRPAQVARRALELAGRERARILLVGMAYKPGVADLRESPSLEILDALRAAGAEVAYHDPMIASFEHDGRLWFSSPPDPRAHDLSVLLVRHPDQDLSWLHGASVLDGTYGLGTLAAERI
jgi:UDP-N-acetyl-D-glucosamine dehydrogenase